jgi:hypothetical protein
MKMSTISRSAARADRLHPGETVRRKLHRVPLALEHQLDGHPHGRIVVDHQYFCHVQVPHLRNRG